MGSSPLIIILEVIMKVAILIAIVCSVATLSTANPVEANVAVEQFKAIMLGAPAAPGDHPCSYDFYCADNTVCCQYNGVFKMCCPVQFSVCCPDMIHCCAQGTHCGNDGKCYYN